MASVLEANQDPQLSDYEAVNAGAKRLLSVKNGAVQAAQAPLGMSPQGVAPPPQGTIPQQLAPTGQARHMDAMLAVAQQEKEGIL